MSGPNPDPLEATRADVDALWREFERLHLAGDREGARDAADVAQRKERWFDEQEAAARARAILEDAGADR